MHSEEKIRLIRTDASNREFLELVTLLDNELGNTYVEQSNFYKQYNQLDEIKNVVLVYEEGKAVACGAMKEFNDEAIEVKRMFTISKYRGRGFARMILMELEKWSKELGYTKSILETGTYQKAAITLYEKNGYILIPNYGQYRGIDTSICFLKNLK